MRNSIFYQNLSKHIFTPNNRFTKLFSMENYNIYRYWFYENEIYYSICIDHIYLNPLCAKHLILLSCNPSKYRTMTDELNDVEI